MLPPGRTQGRKKAWQLAEQTVRITSVDYKMLQLVPGSDAGPRWLARAGLKWCSVLVAFGVRAVEQGRMEIETSSRPNRMHCAVLTVSV